MLETTERQIVWTTVAVRDLEEVHGVDPGAARDLLDASETLDHYTNWGRILPDFPDEVGLRKLLLGDYRLIYRVDERAVHIIRVLRSRRVFRSA